MPVVIAYQSLNSSASKTHDLSASTAQPLTRAAQRTMANIYKAGSGALWYPTNQDLEPQLAIEGPAQLIPVANEDFMDGMASGNITRRTLSMVEGKARQIHQSSYRSMGQACDLIVLGELDSTHADWATLALNAGILLHSSVQDKACNCFSMHSNAGTARPIAEGVGWFAAECKGVVVVFVHVPNRVSADKTKAKMFYTEIKNKLLNSGGRVVDVFMGDTNQPTGLFARDVINEAMGGAYENAHASGSCINPIDTWKERGAKHKGTNSANSKMLDVAVYNRSTVKNIEAKYFTQLSCASGSVAAAHTDHFGVMIKVVKK